MLWIINLNLSGGIIKPYQTFLSGLSVGDQMYGIYKHNIYLWGSVSEKCVCKHSQ